MMANSRVEKKICLRYSVVSFFDINKTAMNEVYNERMKETKATFRLF